MDDDQVIGQTGDDAAADDVAEVTYESCGRLGPHEPHQWLSNRHKNCTGSGEPGVTPLRMSTD